MQGSRYFAIFFVIFQTGHFFELIDNTNPRIVRTVKIIENQNGRVRAVDAAGECHTVLLSSERCKRIGWALLSKNDGHFNLTPFLGTTIKTIVPWFLFDKNQLREHSFEVRLFSFTKRLFFS